MGQISVVSGIPFQALLRDGDGAPLAESSVDMAFGLVDTANVVVWADTVLTTTDAHGLVSTRVGASQSLQSLPWHVGPQLRTSVNLGGEAIDIHGNTVFHQHASGLDPVLPAHFVILNYLNSAMFNLIEQVNAL